MAHPEIPRRTIDTTDEGTVFDALTERDHERAQELDRYINEWVMAPGNLTTHGRAIFMHLYSKGLVHDVFAQLVRQFADINSTIPPSEPMIWQEWAEYWYRGFRPDDLPKH